MPKSKKKLRKNFPVWFVFVGWMSFSSLLLTSLVCVSMVFWFDYYFRRAEILQLGQGVSGIMTLANEFTFQNKDVLRTTEIINEARHVYFRFSDEKTGEILFQTKHFLEFETLRRNTLIPSQANPPIDESLPKGKFFMQVLTMLWENPYYSLRSAYKDFIVYFVFDSIKNMMPPSEGHHHHAFRLDKKKFSVDVLNKSSGLVVYVRLGVTLNNGTPIVLELFHDRFPKSYVKGQFSEGMYLIFTTLFVLLTLIGFWITKRSLRPVSAIAKNMNAVLPTDLSRRLDFPNIPSDLKQIVDSFNGLLERLEQAFLRISQFSEDIAHELRTPLNNLRGSIDVVLRQKRTVEEYQDLLGSNLEECQRLSKMVENLLFLARTERPDMEIEKEPFVIQNELALVADIFEALVEEQGVSLILKVDEKLTLVGDKNLFHRMIVNLVSNAIRYTPTGGCITLGAQVQQKSVLVYVQDTGAGMSPEVVAHVFDRLYRADQARTFKGESNLGLGLAMVKNMMSLHKGTACIQSTPGQGTTVLLEFPL